MTALLDVTALAVQRGGRVLCSGVAMALHAGEGLHLIGANGVGKTSLLRVLAGLSLPAAGQVQARARLLYLGHSIGLKPELSVLENLQFYAQLAGVAAPLPAIESALNSIGLLRVIDAPLQILSAGQRRRIALSRLLIEPAQIWLLDEPFAALDSKSSAWLCSQLDAFMARGGALVLTSHQAVATRMPLREFPLGVA